MHCSAQSTPSNNYAGAPCYIKRPWNCNHSGSDNIQHQPKILNIKDLDAKGSRCISSLCETLCTALFKAPPPATVLVHAAKEKGHRIATTQFQSATSTILATCKALNSDAKDIRCI